MSLLEQIYTDQGVTADGKLCQLWGVDKTHAMPYHPQTNNMIEKNNKGLKDFFSGYVIEKETKHMGHYVATAIESLKRHTPYNYQRYGQHANVGPKAEIAKPVTSPASFRTIKVTKQERLEQANEALRQQQLQIQQDDQEKPLLPAPVDMVWIQKKRRKSGDSNKLQLKFVEPYQVIEADKNHTYKIERQEQSSVQNEVRLKLYYPCAAEPGKALTNLELRGRPNIKGVT